MSHLRLTYSFDAPDDLPNPAAVRFAAFGPMTEQPGLADRKATFVIGAGGLLLSTMLFLIGPLGQFIHGGFWAMFTLVLAIVLGGLALVAIRIAYRSYIIREPGSAENLLYCASIAAGSLTDYKQKLDAITSRQALHDVLDYNFAMATLGAEKYRLTGHALLCLRIAIPLWMLLLILISARGA